MYRKEKRMQRYSKDYICRCAEETRRKGEMGKMERIQERAETTIRRKRRRGRRLRVATQRQGSPAIHE